MLWDNAPHVCALYTVSSSQDAGGGTALTYTLSQSGIACLINTSSSSTAEMYAQDGITVTHCVAIKSGLLTATPTRGVKVVADGQSYHVEGIRSGRAFMAISALTYLDCKQIL